MLYIILLGVIWYLIRRNDELDTQIHKNAGSVSGLRHTLRDLTYKPKDRKEIYKRLKERE